jgi:hypothetical protein
MIATTEAHLISYSRKCGFLSRKLANAHYYSFSDRGVEYANKQFAEEIVKVHGLKHYFSSAQNKNKSFWSENKFRHVRRYLKKLWIAYKGKKPGAPKSLKEAVSFVETLINQTDRARLANNSPEDLSTDPAKAVEVLSRRRQRKARLMDAWYASPRNRAYITQPRLAMHSFVRVQQVFSSDLFGKTEVDRYYPKLFQIVGNHKSYPEQRYYLANLQGERQPGSFAESQLLITTAPNDGDQ